MSNHLACLIVSSMYYLRRFASSLIFMYNAVLLMHQDTCCHLGTFWFNEYKTSSFYFCRSQWLYELLKINSKLNLDFICRLNRSTFAIAVSIICQILSLNFFSQWTMVFEVKNLKYSKGKSTSLSKRSEKRKKDSYEWCKKSESNEKRASYD